MTALARYTSRFSTGVRAWMPLFLEFGLTVASARLAFLFLSNQSYFDRVPSMRLMPGDEWVWGLIAGAACLLKASGMLTLALARRSETAIETAFFLRLFGWGLSFVLWTCLCIAVTLADWTSVGAAALFALAMFSLGVMLSGPAMPDETDGG